MVIIANLPKDTEEEIQRLVDTGDYDDSAEVVVRALARRREKIEQGREMLQPGIDRFDRGETREFTREVREERWQEALRRHAAD